jgi:hypothetical protein
MKWLTFALIALLLICGRAEAQVTGPLPTDSSGEEIAFDVTACQTEFIGPMQMRSGNWALVDSIIAKLGNEHALAYFKRHLHDNRSASFYALIGIHKSGGTSEFEQALAEVQDEDILFQKGCLMIKKPLRQAVVMAINDRF